MQDNHMYVELAKMREQVVVVDFKPFSLHYD
jgi:hypothetical protein